MLNLFNKLAVASLGLRRHGWCPKSDPLEDLPLIGFPNPYTSLSHGTLVSVLHTAMPIVTIPREFWEQGTSHKTWGTDKGREKWLIFLFRVQGWS
jgi:hypothetical protein